MTSTVEAIFENGLLRPLQRLPFAEQQHVWVRVEPIGSPDLESWLALVAQHQQSVLSRIGVLPDSTFEIAEDRRRDV